MAITTLDGIIAGMRPPVDFYKSLTGTLVAGRPITNFYHTGIPGSAVAPTPGIGGAVLTSYSGQIPFTNPTGGQNTYLARFQAQASIAGTLLLCDRLWHNSGLSPTLTTEQVFTGSPQIPSRDMNGSNLGHGVYAGLEISSTTGAGTPTINFKYTNQGGVAGKVTANLVSTVAASAFGTFYPLGLASGDTGIQKAESLTLSATWTSGGLVAVLYRVLARLELMAQTGNSIDALTGGFPRLYDNTVPFLIFIPNTTTSSHISGQIIYSQG